MRFLLLALATLALALPARAGDAPATRHYTKSEWQAALKQLHDFDEIRMTLAVRTVEVPAKWNDGKIKFEKELVFDEPLHTETKIADSAAFLALLEFQPATDNSPHACYGLFNLWFYRKGELVWEVNFAHGEYGAPLTPRSQQAINEWLQARGFPIQETLAREPSTQVAQQKTSAPAHP